MPKARVKVATKDGAVERDFEIFLKHFEVREVAAAILQKSHERIVTHPDYAEMLNYFVSACATASDKEISFQGQSVTYQITKSAN
jgi:hypothetical protein